MIRIHMTPADLNNLRFAFSPLWELAASYWTLMNPSLYAVHLPWVNEAAEALAGRELPYLSALITDTGHFADFMAPTPQTPRPSFEGELARLRDTTPEILSATSACCRRAASPSSFASSPAPRWNRSSTNCASTGRPPWRSTGRA